MSHGQESPPRREACEMGPWVDLHAHPGRCFLLGCQVGDPLVALLGAPAMGEAVADLKAGGVSVASFSTVSDLRVLGPDPERLLCVRRPFEPGEAYADHRRQLDSLRQFAASGEVRVVLSPTDVEAAMREQRVGVLLRCEGADFLEGRLERLAEAYWLGVRAVTLVHYRVNEVGDVQTEPPEHRGLSDFGAAVVGEMNRLGMLIDLAHASFATTAAVVERSRAPVMISHSHLARARAHPRLLSVEHARLVADGGGLIGAWPAGVTLDTFEQFLDEILRLVETVGVDHVGIGTDMAANYRPVVVNHRQYPSIAEGLRRRGLSAGEVTRIMGGNFLRLFAQVSR